MTHMMDMQICMLHMCSVGQLVPYFMNMLL